MYQLRTLATILFNMRFMVLFQSHVTARWQGMQQYSLDSVRRRVEFKTILNNLSFSHQ